MTPEPQPQPAASEPAHEGRNAKGQFTFGNIGGPGNPYARQVAGLRKEITAFLCDGRARPLAEALYERALQGDAACARLLLQYGLGKPAEQPAAPDEVDVHEMHLYARATAPPGYNPLGAMAAETVNEITRTVRPELHKAQLAAGAEMVVRDDEKYQRQKARAQRRKERRAARRAESAAALPEAPPAAPPQLTVEDLCRLLLQHPTMRLLRPERNGHHDGSRTDAHRPPGADDKRPWNGRASDPPRDDGPDQGR